MTSDPVRFAVHQGDALRVLTELPAGFADAIITDPPYSSGGAMRSDRMGTTSTKYGGGRRAKPVADFTGDNRDGRGFAYWSALWIGEARRTLKPGGILALFTDWRQLPTTTDALQAGGLVWRGIYTWHKPSHRMVRGQWSNACEFAVWGTNGPRDPLALVGWSDREALVGWSDREALPGSCSGPIDPHHLFPRLIRPDLVDDPAAIVAACRAHHDWIGAHPSKARAAGFHGRYGDRLTDLAAARSLAAGAAR